VYGDVVLVNGVPWPEMVVERRKYRFRLLNASASRSYRWQLHDGRSAVPMTVIATDGGLMPKPQVVSNLLHGQAERYEVIIDFAKYPDNTLLTLRNLHPKNNEDFETVGYAMRFRVRGDASNTNNNTIPADWEERVPVHECMTFTEEGLRAQGAVQRKFVFERENGHWVINGEDWQKVIDSSYEHCIAEPESESVEIWTFSNPSGGWFHPVHVHLVDFQVLSRNGRADLVRPHERGPKDVVYVGENETIKVAMRFGGPSAGAGWPRPSGRYMMHCHNLVHEDHDMLVQFSAGDHEHVLELDPIKAARPQQG
jgi:FtsP/CotA-like multicopper oxidase with cupredoxin domain